MMEIVIAVAVLTIITLLVCVFTMYRVTIQLYKSMLEHATEIMQAGYKSSEDILLIVNQLAERVNALTQCCNKSKNPYQTSSK